MATWPTATSTTALDSDADELTLARVQIKATADATNDIIACRNSASGIPSLDGSSRVTESQLRQVTSYVEKTANYTLVSTDAQRGFLGKGAITFTMDGNDFNTEGNWVEFKNGNLETTNEEITISLSNGIFEGSELSITLRPGDWKRLILIGSTFYAWGPQRTQIGGTSFFPHNFAYFNTKTWEAGGNWTTVASDLTENTWETVGPTGSGADNIWTALDDVPSFCRFIYLRCDLIASAIATGACSLKVEVRDYADAGSDATLANMSQYTDNVVSNEATGTLVVPIDSNGRFGMRWNGNANNSSEVIRLYLHGFWS